jgi:hypothetical protein
MCHVQGIWQMMLLDPMVNEIPHGSIKANQMLPHGMITKN